MTRAKFDIKKFDGTGDFGLWRIKMCALLIQHGCEAALKVLPADMEAQTKAELNKKAHSAVILCLANKLYLKKKLYTFYMLAGRKIFEHVDKFNKIVLDLANIEVKFKDEDLALLLLTSLPASYKHFVDTLLYVREELTLEDMMATLNSKEIKERYKAEMDDGEGLYVRGRTDHRDSRCSYHMTPRLDILFDFLECDEGSVQLGDNRECKIRGTLEKEGYTVKLQSGKVKVIKGSRVILSRIRKDNCMYSLDGHAMAGELNASVEEKGSLAQEGIGLYPQVQTRSIWKVQRVEAFEQLCIESGIARHLKVVETPQQNGVAELMNRTLMDKKDTLKDSGVDQEDGDDEDARDQETDQILDLTDYQLAQDREPRTRTKPLRFRDESSMVAYAFVVAEEEDTHGPLTYQEAELVDHPAGQKLVSCKWMFKIKEGIEVRHASIRVILALTACKDYELEQRDVKTAFLHGNLEEVIYMRQPPGYEQGNKVCLLKKSLYGLKQSPRQWYKRFDEYMLSNGFKRSSYDNYVYYRSYAPGEYIYLLLYVDDMLITCKSKAEIRSTKSLLKKEFDMKELGEAKKILGMDIVRDRSRKILKVSQSGYVSKILNNYRIDNGKSVKMPLGGHFKLSLKDFPVKDCDVERMSKVPYANTVKSLMYLMVCTRPNIAYAVSVVSRYLANPSKNHWEAVKWILRFLRGTANVGLVYGTNCGNYVDVTCFVDSDYAKDPNKGSSITGYTFLVQGCVVSWKAMLQQVVALSTTEAEYRALTKDVKEVIWLRGLLEELGVEINTMAVNCDN
ncbi:retrotransposon protein, putative, ty1-copia subclass [Tanacetum coccineum]